MKIKGQTTCKVLDNVFLSMSMNFIIKKHQVQASNHNGICLRRKVEVLMVSVWPSLLAVIHLF